MSSYSLIVEGGDHAGKCFEFPRKGPYIIGRAPDTHVRFSDADNRVSRYHAVLEPVADGIRIRDLQSSNGTFVNGARVLTALLRPGDRLRVGRTVLMLSRLAVIDERTSDVGIAAPSAISTLDASGDASMDDVVTPGCEGCGKPCGETTVPEPYIGVPWLCDTCAAARRKLGPNDPPTLGAFELLRPVAAGPSAIVYEGRHSGTGCLVAVKRLTPTGRLERSTIRRLLQEQQLAITLVHPRITRCYESGQDRRSHDLYVATEWMGRGDASRISAPTTALRQAILLGADLFEALAYLHALGLVHHDVKPQNLLMSSSERGRQSGKLGDFGVGKNLRSDTPNPLESGWQTPMFMAPEQITAVREPQRTIDIYAGAVTLYHLLTASTPLVLRGESPSFTETLDAIRSRERISLAARRPDAPRRFVEWIDRAVAADPLARESMTAGDIADRLRRLV